MTSEALERLRVHRASAWGLAGLALTLVLVEATSLAFVAHDPVSPAYSVLLGTGLVGSATAIVALVSSTTLLARERREGGGGSGAWVLVASLVVLVAGVVVGALGVGLYASASLGALR